MGGYIHEHWPQEERIPPNVLLQACDPIIAQNQSGDQSVSWRLGSFDEDLTVFSESPERQAQELFSIIEQAPTDADVWHKSGVKNEFEHLDPYAIIVQRALLTASRNVAASDELTHELRRAFAGPRRHDMVHHFLPAYGSYALLGIWAEQNNDPLAVSRLTAFGHDVLTEEEFPEEVSFVEDTKRAVEAGLRFGKPWTSVGSALLNLLMELPRDSYASQELGELYRQEQQLQEETVAARVAEEITNGDVRRFPELVEILHNPFAISPQSNAANMLQLLKSALHVEMDEERYLFWTGKHHHSGYSHDLAGIFDQAREIVTGELKDYISDHDEQHWHAFADPDELRSVFEDILYHRCTTARSPADFWMYYKKAVDLFGKRSQLAQDMLEYHPTRFALNSE